MKSGKRKIVDSSADSRFNIPLIVGLVAVGSIIWWAIDFILFTPVGDLR